MNNANFKIAEWHNKNMYVYLIGEDESTIQFIDQDYADIKQFFGNRNY